IKRQNHTSTPQSSVTVARGAARASRPKRKRPSWVRRAPPSSAGRPRSPLRLELPLEELLVLDDRLHAVHRALAELPAVHEDRRGAADLGLAGAELHVGVDEGIVGG